MDPLQTQPGAGAGMPPQPGAGMPPQPGQPPMGPDGKPVKFATPEQKQKLLDLIEATRGKVGEFNAQSFAADNKMQSTNNEVLRQLFAILQSAGVDLTDPKSVSDFLNQLRTQNPQMSQIFEDALNQLLGGTPPQEPAPPIPGGPGAAPDMGGGAPPMM